MAHPSRFAAITTSHGGSIHRLHRIYYYDKRDSDLGAEDPSDETTTERTLTLMLAEEY